VSLFWSGNDDAAIPQPTAPLVVATPSHRITFKTRDDLRLEVSLAEMAFLMRTECGISQAELFRRTGINQQRISQIETGATLPTLLTLQRIAEATGCEFVFTAQPLSD
jgi:DNA-binding XRE family transcriptional regulator